MCTRQASCVCAIHESADKSSLDGSKTFRVWLCTTDSYPFARQAPSGQLTVHARACRNLHKPYRCVPIATCGTGGALTRALPSSFQAYQWRAQSACGKHIYCRSDYYSMESPEQLGELASISIDTYFKCVNRGQASRIGCRLRQSAGCVLPRLLWCLFEPALRGALGNHGVQDGPGRRAVQHVVVQARLDLLQPCLQLCLRHLTCTQEQLLTRHPLLECNAFVSHGNMCG